MSRTYKRVKYYEVVILIVDASKAKDFLISYQNQGYRSRGFGPKVTKFPKCDPNRIKMVFEKEIELKK